MPKKKQGMFFCLAGGLRLLPPTDVRGQHLLSAVVHGLALYGPEKKTEPA